MKWGELTRRLRDGSLDGELRRVYGEDASQAARRLLDLMDGFTESFPPGEEALLFSAPGRTELGGNHTDHQHGRCLASSVDLDTIACVVPNGSRTIRVQSQGHQMAQVELDDLSVHEDERDTSQSLVRGVAARITELGYKVGGFDAYTTTRVLRGSGLSSSAAFEVLVGAIINRLSCGGALTPVQIAQIGQYAENRYYGKPCGLLDQLSCSVGGVIGIDFADPSQPEIRRLEVEASTYGYALCIVDSRASHADLTDEYAAIPREMKQAAAFFGKEVLRQVPEEEFFRRLSEVRKACGDRAALRAIHFFAENRRALRQRQALEEGDFEGFLRLVRASGRSSFMYLQNVSTYRDSADQPVALLLAAAEDILDGQGACRVHGGGFAGTMQAFVPLDKLEAFTERMEALAGPGACQPLRLRSVGAAVLAE